MKAIDKVWETMTDEERQRIGSKEELMGSFCPSDFNILVEDNNVRCNEIGRNCIDCWNQERVGIIIKDNIATDNTSNILSYTLDTQYGYYIKSQDVSAEEKMAVKKFIEFVRKNINETKDTKHYKEIE